MTWRFLPQSFLAFDAMFHICAFHQLWQVHLQPVLSVSSLKKTQQIFLKGYTFNLPTYKWSSIYPPHITPAGLCDEFLGKSHWSHFVSQSEPAEHRSALLFTFTLQALSWQSFQAHLSRENRLRLDRSLVSNLWDYDYRLVSHLSTVLLRKRKYCLC